jgi:hypothetical protein
MDKGLYQAPQGIGSLPEAAPIEIIIEDPKSVTIAVPVKTDEDFDENLAEEISESDLSSLAVDLLGDYEADCQARKDWLETYVKGLKLLGLKYDERTEPWAGACGVQHPLLMESAVKFCSETIMEVFPASGPVKALVIGKETPDKLAAALRVKDDMNYQLTEVMSEYRPEHEKLLTTLCLSGNAFKKIYFDPSLNRQTAPYIPAEDVVVPYGATSIESAERVTHKMRKTKNELRKLQLAGFYREIDLGDPVLVMDEVEKQKAILEQGTYSTSIDNRFQILEMHVNLNFLDDYKYEDRHGDKTGIELPYVVTIEKGTRTVLAIRRNWLKDDELKLRRQHFVHYGYIPGFGFYYFGLIHLIGGHTKSATSLLRQLIDAGTLSNLPGGLKAKGLRIKGDDTPIAPGEFRDVDLMAGSIKDNILPLPYKEPSQVLLALMNQVIEDGRRFAAQADLKVSDMSSQSPVGTTLAILERTLKVMSAVQARIHNVMKQEFKLLAAIIRDHTPEEYNYEPEIGSASAKQSDYDMVDVIPVSDPNSSTMSQRVVQYQAVLQLSQTAPQIYNLPFLHRQMIETLGVKNASKIVPDKDQILPMDPVSENMAVLMGKPVKAFLYQDHESHIRVHMAAMQDPKMMQIIGQNPQAQLIMGAAAAHLMEHVAFEYRKQIEKQLGASLPPPPDFLGDDPESPIGHLPPAIETQISYLAAQAAGQLLQKDKAEAQMMQAQQQQQDPLFQLEQQKVQIAQQEVQIKQADQQLKAQLAQAKQQLDERDQQLAEAKHQLDAALKQAKEQREDKRLMLDAASKKDDMDLKHSQHELDGAKLGAEIANQKHGHILEAAKAADQHHLDEGAQELDGARLGVEIGKHHMEHHADIQKHKDDQAHDLHKHQTTQHADLRKHAATLNTDIHKHETSLAQEHRHHADEIKIKEKIANKPAPKPTGSKK